MKINILVETNTQIL